MSTIRDPDPGVRPGREYGDLLEIAKCGCDPHGHHMADLIGWASRDASVHLYGVSFGDGNDGVSHLFPDYWVWTDDPYRLAELAVLGQIKPAYHEVVQDELDIDGEAEFTIYATLYEEPMLASQRNAEEAEHEERQSEREAEHEEEQAELQAEAEARGEPFDYEPFEAEPFEPEESTYAWMICEVFRSEEYLDPEDANAPMYDSLAECFDAALLAKVAASD